MFRLFKFQTFLVVFYCFLWGLLSWPNYKTQLVKGTWNILYTFWGQKEIETDICPGETFNDSCSSSNASTSVVDKSVFRVLHVGEKLYYKRQRNDTSRYKTISFFFKFKESHLKNEPVERNTPTLTKLLPVNSPQIKGWKWKIDLFVYKITKLTKCSKFWKHHF